MVDLCPHCGYSASDQFALLDHIVDYHRNEIVRREVARKSPYRKWPAVGEDIFRTPSPRHRHRSKGINRPRRVNPTLLSSLSTPERTSVAIKPFTTEELVAQVREARQAAPDKSIDQLVAEWAVGMADGDTDLVELYSYFAFIVLFTDSRMGYTPPVPEPEPEEQPWEEGSPEPLTFEL